MVILTERQMNEKAAAQDIKATVGICDIPLMPSNPPRLFQLVTKYATVPHQGDGE